MMLISMTTLMSIYASDHADDDNYESHSYDVPVIMRVRKAQPKYVSFNSLYLLLGQWYRKKVNDLRF